MKAYEHLYNATDVNMIIDNINDMFNKVKKDMFSACHGRYHTMSVVDKTEHILKSLSYDSRTIELGKIAALLHDIGNIAGRWNHARKSAVIAGVFFDGSDHLLPNEKEMVMQAIEDHSDGDNISSAVGAALMIADKADISKRRILPVENINAWSANLLEIDDLTIDISGSEISINFIITDKFSKELLMSGYENQYDLSKKAAGYFGRTFRYKFNDI